MVQLKGDCYSCGADHQAGKCVIRHLPLGLPTVSPAACNSCALAVLGQCTGCAGAVNLVVYQLVCLQVRNEDSKCKERAVSQGPVFTDTHPLLQELVQFPDMHSVHAVGFILLASGHSSSFRPCLEFPAMHSVHAVRPRQKRYLRCHLFSAQQFLHPD